MRNSLDGRRLTPIGWSSAGEKEVKNDGGVIDVSVNRRNKLKSKLNATRKVTWHDDPLCLLSILGMCASRALVSSRCRARGFVLPVRRVSLRVDDGLQLQHEMLSSCSSLQSVDSVTCAAVGALGACEQTCTVCLRFCVQREACWTKQMFYSCTVLYTTPLSMTCV